MVALSTMDAELQASSDATRHAMWLKKLLADLDIHIDAVSIMNNNSGAIALTKNPENWDKSKHFNIRQNFVCDKVNEKMVSLDKVASKDNTADILTKPLGIASFDFHRDGPGLTKQQATL